MMLAKPLIRLAGARVHRLLATLFAATLGGACTSSSTRAVAPTGDKDSSHGTRSHGHEHAGHRATGHHGFADAEAWTKVFDDPERDAWQRPDEVLQLMELTPTMVVADVGAGTGYFAVRLASAVPQGAVIATDAAPDMVRFLNDRASRERLPNLRAIQTTHTAPGLTADSVDRILVVDVWHHLSGRVAFARELAAALRPGGKLFIVDFKLTAERGPPADMRLAPESIVAELEKAGFIAKVSLVSLPDQYIVEAHRGP